MLHSVTICFADGVGNNGRGGAAVTTPLATHDYAGLDAARSSSADPRGAALAAQGPRSRDRLHIIDVNKDYFEVRRPWLRRRRRGAGPQLVTNS